VKSVETVRTRRPAGPGSDMTGGKVTKVDSSGAVYVTPEGGDERHPVGPCRGARYRPPVVLVCPAGAHSHDVPPPVPLPVGTRVLLATTPTGPWVISWEDTAP
jgi:hypothetical protein